MTPTFTPLPDLCDVAPFGPADEVLFAELRDVLAKHGALERFGIVLLHRHFPLQEDERLVEFVTVQDRVLTIRPVADSDAHKAVAIQTQWRLDRQSPTLGCEQWCYEDPATEEYLSTGHQSTDDD